MRLALPALGIRSLLVREVCQVVAWNQSAGGGPPPVHVDPNDGSGLEGRGGPGHDHAPDPQGTDGEAPCRRMARHAGRGAPSELEQPG